MEKETLQYRSLSTNENALSEEEALLLEEKQLLSRVVEGLKLKRLAVVTERLKVEDEVHRRAEEEEAQRREAAEALRRSEAARYRLETEEKALRQLTRDLTRRRVEMETRRQVAVGEVRRLAETGARIRSQENLSRRVAQAPVRLGDAGREALRLVEAEGGRSNAEGQAPRELSLGQRLRAEIDGLAAAQRKHIDASRAQLNVRRRDSLAHATTAA